ncbi:Sok1p SCDLUD_002526 [Saccharomycodes ludwigii]|nr:hypothetical protein SCDLUD_002526 [Saccharomycodes ludwigii]KAH3901052.1 hypothetical protein SCDLUD_002526 [Saccharomycodes ludwigii]
MNGYTENNRKKSLLNGLKQAILLNDEKIPYPSSSSSSSLSVSSSVKHRLKTLKQINEIYPIMSNNAIINPGAVIPSLDMPLEVRARYIKESFGVSLDATRNTTAFIKNARQQKEIDIPLPPINLDCLKEIDLTEIVKNPQLRHDIIFDPMLQFRPNMDGERGLKKRKISEKYWNDVSIEISVYLENSKLFDINANRLVPLFNSLKEILISLVPEKDIQNISLVLDTDLIIQQFLNKSLNISDFADWLTQLFKSHCAPMRDIWVDSINKSFKDAEATNSINKLIDSFKSVFQLLEAMKLDIANHQIRILRPALISNAIEFERQYFHTLMASKRINLRNSLEWFSTKYTENFNKSDHKLSPYPLIPDCYNVCAKSIIQLLSCRKMVKEFPLALSFDHTRLTLLRADIRQIVCLLVCRLLFKQMVINETSIGTTANSSIENRMERDYIFQQYTNKNLRDDIISIITDQHGNCRWTKNTMSISIHLCKKIAELRTDYALHVEARKGKRDFVREVSPTNYINVVKTNNVSNGRTPTNIQLDRSKIEFAKSWLSKQTQPLSEVYTVLETRVFNYLQDTIIKRSHITEDGQVNQDFINLVGADEQHQAQINGISTDGSITITRGSNVVNNTTTTDAESVTNSNKNKNGFDRDKEDKIQSDITNPNGVNKDNSNITGFMKNSFELEEVDALCTNLYIVINLHWSVFGFYYVDYVRQKLKKMFQAKEGAKGENDNDSAGAEIKVLLGDNK